MGVVRKISHWEYRQIYFGSCCDFVAISFNLLKWLPPLKLCAKTFTVTGNFCSFSLKPAI